MKVLLIDVDRKIPNLALMQISSHHKAKGHMVGFDIEAPDLVYISCVFKKNAWKVHGYKSLNPAANVHIGGSGISWDWLPKSMRKIKPDYDLYPDMNYSMGFTTRGCPNNCSFCVVPEKEGKLHRWQHIKEFHDERFNKVYLHDNNWYADKEWFFENSQYCIDNNLKVNPSQGLDIRLLNEEIAKRLSQLKFWANIHFAWDDMKTEKYIERGIEILKNQGIDLKHHIQFYVLVGFNTTIEEDIYRCQKLKEWGTNAFVMPYKITPEIRRLARWANRKWIFWACDFKDYTKKKRN